MNKRRLGRSTIEIAPLMLGGNVFGDKVDQVMTNRLLDQFTDAGFNAIDTADVYVGFIPGKHGGESETQIGAWLAQGGGRRERIVIATKVGYWEHRKGLSRDNIVVAVEESLRRLQTDYVDVYMSHIDDESVPFEETLRAYDDLIRAGKVRVIGASNFSADRLRQSLMTSARLGISRYECIEPLFNLMEQSIYPGALQNLCLEEHIGVTPYWSLACGFLTGKYREEDTRFGGWRDRYVSKYLNARGFATLQALDQVAMRHQAKVAQVALAWLMSQPGVSAPIASATTPEQLDELMEAPNLKLTDQDLAELEIP